MRTLFLDCFAGISGNMFLGALIDLGLPEEVLTEELAKLNLSGYKIAIKQVKKLGISAVYLDVKAEKQHHHRYLADIFGIIEAAALEQPVKDVAKKIFSLLAEAEAKVHGTTIESIHFHEVGAVDAIVDIVGAAIGLNYLGISEIFTSKLRTGTGFVDCAHGRMPVPAPATAELLLGIAHESGDIARELVTPTGAAIVAALCIDSSGMPDGFIGQSVGYGAGTWDLEIPNVLRAVVGTVEKPNDDGRKLVVETNIDDMNPQIYPYVIEKLLAAGAADAWLTPVIMKKGRPGITLAVLAEESALEEVFSVLHNETSAIGLRYYQVNRDVASRENITVSTPWGDVGVKISSRTGYVSNIAPEYEDCRKIAQENGIPLKSVWQRAMEAARELHFTY